MALTPAEKQRAYRERKAKREGRPIPKRMPRGPRKPKPAAKPAAAAASQPAAAGAEPPASLAEGMEQTQTAAEANILILAQRTLNAAVKNDQIIPVDLAARVVMERMKMDAAAGRSRKTAPPAPPVRDWGTR